MLPLVAGTASVEGMGLADSDQRIGNTSYETVNSCLAVTKKELAIPLMIYSLDCFGVNVYASLLVFYHGAVLP